MKTSLPFLARLRPLFLVSVFGAVFLTLANPALAALTAAQLDTALDSNGTIAWQAQTDAWTIAGPADSHDGTAAVRTPPLRNGDSTLRGRVEGPGTLRGWIRASSEKFQDRLDITLDGTVRESFSGESAREFTLAIPRGSFEISFTWTKDTTRTGGADAAWLDTIRMEHTAVSVEEALDIAGTPNAGRLTFTTPDGPVPPWQPIAGKTSARGSDALFASAGGQGNTLLVTATAPSLVSFRTLEPDTIAPLKVTFLQGAQTLQREKETSGWILWRVLLPQNASLQFDFPRPSFPGNSAVGHLLDDWTVDAIAAIPLSEALDAPGLTFTQEWSGVQKPDYDPWYACTIPASSGFASDNSDALIALPAAEAQYQTIRTTLTGPGRLSLRWRTAVNSGNGLNIEWKEPGAFSSARATYIPSWTEWQGQTLDLPPGPLEIKVTWNTGAPAIVLDQFLFTPTPRDTTSPTVRDAGDVSSSLTINHIGNWLPGRWEGAGAGNDDVLRWADGPFTPFNVTANGPGWFTFAWRARPGFTLSMSVDGQAAGFTPFPYPNNSTQDQSGEWQFMARALPAGSHTVLLSASTSFGGPFPGESVFLDSLTFSPNPPAWIQGLEGTGISSWQMSGDPWSVVTDVTHDGTDAVRFPPAGAGRGWRLAAQVQGPGTIRFHWGQGDPLPLAIPNTATFLYNGAVFSNGPALRGQADWQAASVELQSDGVQTVWWDFLRSTRATLPGDGLWLDEVSFTPATTVSLATALDTPDLTWTSLGDFRPLGGGGFSQSTGGAVVQLPVVTTFPPPEAWLQTTIPGPGVVEVKYNTGPGSPPFELWIDGARRILPNGSQNPVTAQVTGAGPHTCRIVCPARYALLELDSFTYTPLPVVTVADALDLPASIIPEMSGPLKDSLPLLDAAASHDGTDALRLTSQTSSFASSVSVPFTATGPTAVRFWWRGGTPSNGSFIAAMQPANTSISRDGLFPWEERSVTTTRLGGNTAFFTCRALNPPGYLAWLDQVRVEPFVEVPLAQALHAGALAFTTGGSAEWKGWRPPDLPPGPNNEELAGVYIPFQDAAPAWFETTVTGPGLLFFKPEFPATNVAFRITTTPAGGGPATTYAERAPLAVPPGLHTIRFDAWRTYVPSGNASEISVILRDVSFAPTPAIAASLGTPDWTWTTTPSPDGFWYGDTRRPPDSTSFAGDSLVRVSGQATLETTLTGPGWLQFEAELPPVQNGQPWPFGYGMNVRVFPPGTPPGSLPNPAITLNNADYYSGTPRNTPVKRNLWIPAGPQQIAITARHTATLSRFRFTPALDAAATAAALDLTPGLTVSFPKPEFGPVLSPVSHDGTDALQVVGFQGGGSPAVSFSFTGPALLTGWLRAGELHPNTQGAGYNPLTAAEPGVLPYYEGLASVTYFLNDQGMLLYLDYPAPPGHWVPVRIPVTATGPQTVSFGMGLSAPSFVLQLDEMALTPFTPVTLTDALDAPSLTWTAAPQSWSGFASAVASPDGTDAAWLTVPRSVTPPALNPELWLETKLTGPGTLQFLTWGASRLKVTVDGVPWAPRESVSYDSGRWAAQDLYIPEEEHTIRFEPDSPGSWVVPFGIDRVQWTPAALITIPVALDVPSNTPVSTGGASAGSWQGSTAATFAFDEEDFVIFRGSLTDQPWLELPVTGPAFVSFRTRNHFSVDLAVTLDGAPLRASRSSNNGVGAAVPRNVSPPAVPQSYTRGYWLPEEFFLPAGTHTLRWTLSPSRIPANPDPGAILFGLDALSIVPAADAPSFAEALDQSAITLTTDRPDKIIALAVPQAAHDHTDSVLILGDNAESSPRAPALVASFPGPGLVHYRWRALGSSYYFTPRHEIPEYPGQYPPPFSGVIEEEELWSRATVILPNAGPQSLTFYNEGENNGYIIDALTYSPGLTFGEATGAPALPWTTGGPAPVLALPPLPSLTAGSITPHAGIYGASDIPSWIETTVTGPGRLTFVMKGEGGRFLYDGFFMHYSSTADDTLTLVVPPGLHTLRWEARRNLSLTAYAYMQLSSVQWTPSAAVDPVAEALDAPALPWLFAPKRGAWTPQNTDTHDGTDALRYNSVDNVLFPWLRTVLPVPGTAFVRVHATGRFGFSGAFPSWTVQPLTWANPEPNLVHLSFSSSLSNDPGTIDLDTFSYISTLTSLADAFDAPGQIWETSLEHPFIGYAAGNSFNVTHDLTDAVMAEGGVEDAWMRTTVTGPARVSFLSRGNGGLFTVDGSPVSINNPGGWINVLCETGPGTHVLRWEKRGLEPWGLDEFSLTSLPPGTSLAEALDHPGPWTTSPNSSPWLLSNTDTADGSDAALFPGSGGPVTGPGLTITGPGRLEFSGRLPLSAAQHLPIVTNANQSLRFSAPFTGAWQPYAFDLIPPGEHELRWTLPPASAGESPAGLDQVKYTPYAPLTLTDALDAASLTFSTPPVEPWTAWACGTAASDGQDAVISGTSDDSLLTVTVPPGSGELSFMAMSPRGGGYAMMATGTVPNFLVPEQWKLIRYPVAAGDDRSIGINPANNQQLWLDDMKFTPSSVPLTAWLAAHALPAHTSLTTDPDGDGQPLLFEYAFGLDPNTPGIPDPSAPSLAALPVVDYATHPNVPVDVLRCRFLRRTGGTGLNYEVIFSSAPDTSGPLFSGVKTEVEELTNDWDLVTVYDGFPPNGAPPTRFARVRVTYTP